MSLRTNGSAATSAAAAAATEADTKASMNYKIEVTASWRSQRERRHLHHCS
jgi:hypothetical protein